MRDGELTMKAWILVRMHHLMKRKIGMHETEKCKEICTEDEIGYNARNGDIK
jgi:hypothetical protein